MADEVRHRLAVDDRATELKGRHVPQEDAELDRITAVRADALASELNIFLRRIRRQIKDGRIPRSARGDKDDHHEENKRDKSLRDTTNNVSDGHLPPIRASKSGTPLRPSKHYPK